MIRTSSYRPWAIFTLICMFLAGTAQLALARTFPDTIALPEEANTAIESLAQTNVVQGYSDGNFYPKRNINRGEFFKMLVRGRGITQEQNYRDCFSDMKNRWSESYVCYAKNAGWLDGYSNDNDLFYPLSSITHAEALGMMFKAFNVTVETSLQDPWYITTVNFAAEAGIISFQQNTADYAFSPIYREEVAVMLYNVIQKYGTSPITMSVSSWTVPLTVSITGPVELKARIEDCVYSQGWYGTSGNGLVINWGDGKDSVPSEKDAGFSANASCADITGTHQYAVPGVYTIDATLWHPGAADAPETDWHGTAIVTVTGSPQTTGTTLTVLPPENQSPPYLYQELPEARWHLITTKPYDLRVELINEDGTIMVSKVMPHVAYIGDDYTLLTPTSFDEYNNKLKMGKNRFIIRATLFDQGNVIVSSVGQPFSVSPETRYTQMGDVTINPSNRVVSFTYKMAWQPTCFLYQINWGDGSSIDANSGPLPTSCQSFSLQNQQFSHTYGASGTYTIRMRSNASDVNARVVDDVASYETITVQIP